MRQAVLGGGKRLRSRLTLLSAAAAAAQPLSPAAAALALDAACAIELVHAGSLVHDDMPCFDNAPLRRGQPTIHKVYGEPAAMLTGDALLTLAFEVLSQPAAAVLPQAMRIVSLMARCVGSREGIIGGQSLELSWTPQRALGDIPNLTEPELQRQASAVARYHRMKTGALFGAAAQAGALAAGVRDLGRWSDLGQSIGQFFQLTDDLYDVAASAAGAIKPVGQDATQGRPNAALLVGTRKVQQELQRLIETIELNVTEIAANDRPLRGLLSELRSYMNV